MTMTDIPALPVTAFPPEHYACPPWCEASTEPPVPGCLTGHDSGDGLLGWPGFDGYHHHRSAFVPYAAAEPFTVQGALCRNPLSVSLEQPPGDFAPHVLLLNEDEDEHPVHLKLTLA
jgi:hypothetical protein